MPPSAARIRPHASSSRARTATAADPIVIYVGNSLDGTSFALDPRSQKRIREVFPGVSVSTRHIFIAHDTREEFERTIGRFEDQIAILLTGVSAEQLSQKFPLVSFRDPRSEREVRRLAQACKGVEAATSHLILRFGRPVH